MTTIVPSLISGALIVLPSKVSVLPAALVRLPGPLIVLLFRDRSPPAINAVDRFPEVS